MALITSLLFKFIEQGNLQGVKYFIESGQDVNTIDEDGDNLLMNSIFNEQHEVTEFLLEQGAVTGIHEAIIERCELTINGESECDFEMI